MIPRPLSRAASLIATFLLPLGFPLSAHAADASKDAPADNQCANCPLNELSKRGIELHGSYIGEVLGNTSGGFARKTAPAALLKLELSADLEKAVGWQGGSFYASGYYPHGKNLSERAIGDLHGVSNIAAYNSARLFELWLEQKAGPFSLRIGQLAADSEFTNSDTGGLFINSCFGVIPNAALSIDVPIYPVGTPGARIRYELAPNLSLAVAAYYGSPGDPATNNKNGTRFRADSDDGMFYISELAWVPNPESKLPGSYKIGGFYHSHQVGDVDGVEGVIAPTISGIYAVADQKLTSAGKDGSEGFTAFSRVGITPEDRSVLSFYAEFGGVYQGLIPNRSNDLLGLASSFAHTGGGNGLRQTETVIECTYKAQICEHFSLQPDVQYIINPGANSQNGDALVVGLRAEVTF